MSGRFITVDGAGGAPAAGTLDARFTKLQKQRATMGSSTRARVAEERVAQKGRRADAINAKRTGFQATRGVLCCEVISLMLARVKFFLHTPFLGVDTLW
jgi:hypothetical protein